MSHKIAKRVRKMLKTEGVDVTNTFYTRDKTGSIVLDKSGRKTNPSLSPKKRFCQK